MRVDTAIVPGLLLLLQTTAPAAPEEPDSLRARPSSDAPDLEQLLHTTETEDSRSQLLDRLLRLQDHPLDLNTATAEDLQMIPGVTVMEARAVDSLRVRLGRFADTGQLDSLEPVLPGFAAAIRPYVSVARGTRSFGRSGTPTVEWRSRVQKDLQPRLGFRDGSFAGSQVNHYHRIEAAVTEDLSVGGVAEKDAGERWADGFRSGYVDVAGLPAGLHAILGDYTVGGGQGLVLWNSATFDRGSGASGFVRRSGGGPQPNRSADESRYLRGIAVKATPVPGLQAMGFYSARDRAATVDENGVVTSFDASGLFRTEGERGRNHAVKEKTIGGRVSFGDPDLWDAGVTFSRTELSAAFIPDRARGFGGRTFSAAGIDARVQTGDVLWFAEGAHTAGGGSAGIAGAVVSIGLRTEAAVAYRSYGAEFVTLHGAGAGQGQDTRNEEGVTLAVSSRISRVLSVNASFDHYRYPWHTALRVFPSAGSETFIEALMHPRPRLEFSARYTMRGGESGERVADSLQRERVVQVERRQQNLRLTAVMEPVRRVRLRTRLEIVDVSLDLPGRHERGILLYEDVSCAVSDWLTAEVRLVFFDTESYDARVYEFENDVRGAFANPALYGRGRRWYVLLRTSPVGGILTFSCKYAATQKEGIRTISSGNTEIAGDLDDRFSLQLDLRL
jgi:hypothetical protein